MSNTKLRDRQASSNRCQLPTAGAVLKLLFTLFDYYADFFCYYIYYFKISSGVLGEYSLRKSASMFCGSGTEAANHHSAGAEAENHPSSSTTIFPCPMDGPIAPSSCRAAYVSYRYLSQPDGGTLVLPHVISKTQIDKDLNSQNHHHNMHNFHNKYNQHNKPKYV